MYASTTGGSSRDDRGARHPTTVDYAIPLQSLLDSIPYGFAYYRLHRAFDITAELVCLTSNTTFARLTGIEPLPGKSIATFLPGWPESRQELLEIAVRVVCGGRRERYEHHDHIGDRWYCISIYSPRPEHLVVLIEDITRHKRIMASTERPACRLRLVDPTNRMLAWSCVEHAIARAQRHATPWSADVQGCAAAPLA